MRVVWCWTRGRGEGTTVGRGQGRQAEGRNVWAWDKAPTAVGTCIQRLPQGACRSRVFVEPPGTGPEPGDMGMSRGLVPQRSQPTAPNDLQAQAFTLICAPALALTAQMRPCAVVPVRTGPQKQQHVHFPRTWHRNPPRPPTRPFRSTPPPPSCTPTGRTSCATPWPNTAVPLPCSSHVHIPIDTLPRENEPQCNQRSSTLHRSTDLMFSIASEPNVPPGPLSSLPPAVRHLGLRARQLGAPQPQHVPAVAVGQRAEEGGHGPGRVVHVPAVRHR